MVHDINANNCLQLKSNDNIEQSIAKTARRGEESHSSLSQVKKKKVPDIII